MKGLPTQSLVTGIARTVRAMGVAARVKFTGHHLPVLAALRVLIPEARLGLFVPPCQPWMSNHLYQQIVVTFASFGAFDVVQCPTPLLPMLDLDGVRKLGLQVLTNCLDDEDISAAVGAEVDAICSDDPARVLALLDPW